MNEIIEEWLEIKEILDAAKKEELELRNKVIESFGSSQVSGAETIKKDGWKITIGHTIRSTLDESVLNTIYQTLPDKEKNCIKFKPGLVSQELKKLDGTEMLYEAIITKPGQNTLSIKCI